MVKLVTQDRTPLRHTVAELRALPDEKITARQVARHAVADDCWISLYGRVYDATHLHPYHPGGDAAIMQSAGCDVGGVYDNVEHPPRAVETLERFRIGVLVTDEQAAALGLPDDDSGIVQRLDALYGSHEEENDTSAADAPRVSPLAAAPQSVPTAPNAARVVATQVLMAPKRVSPKNTAVTVEVSTEVKVMAAALLALFAALVLF
jgi:cytochrome b involved in lipid metabolism